MSEDAMGAQTIYRKLVFGSRAQMHVQAPRTDVPTGAASATGALPSGVSGGEDFGQHELETL